MSCRRDARRCRPRDARERRDELMERIRGACAEGRQAYWVCTLIEEATKSSRRRRRHLRGAVEALPELRIGLVHGRMKPTRSGTMRRSSGASIDAAGRDHRDRGRRRRAQCRADDHRERRAPRPRAVAPVARPRGSRQRREQLRAAVPVAAVAIARQRSKTMRQTHDGFVIAEKDLELRGPGELLGTRQTGLAVPRGRPRPRCRPVAAGAGSGGRDAALACG